ncbi:hypothetical protein NSU_2351 [Novosphingobium pentaromativorans US6-1]|uniref:Uncharacterized protein n=1 Tax=Novosphingobium pentaromativorans US6-1 TaxID=1088721 RepID=G6EDD1_9SPHN|nr:hypothetical protein NSU_2351 [Novosphingobium pentaromativorans US6-1]
MQPLLPAAPSARSRQEIHSRLEQLERIPELFFVEKLLGELRECWNIPEGRA